MDKRIQSNFPVIICLKEQSTGNMKLNILHLLILSSIVNVIVMKLKDKINIKQKLQGKKKKNGFVSAIIIPIPIGYGFGVPFYGGVGLGGYGGYGGFGGGLGLGGFGGGFY